MISFKPFKAVTPTDFKKFSENLQSNKSFVDIINPYSSLKKKNEDPKNIYKKVRNRYLSLKNNNFFSRDNQSCFYIYQREEETDFFIGIVGIISTKNYLDNKIKLHEQTLLKRQEVFTFVDIINPYSSLKKKNEDPKNIYKKVRNRYLSLKNNNFFSRDNQSCFYIYQREEETDFFIGIVGIISTKNYLDNKIKLHEQTLLKRQEVFTEYLKQVKINAEPVLVFSNSNKDIDKIISEYNHLTPNHEFLDENNFINKIWRIDNYEHINTIQEVFKGMNNVFLGDGHHRACASTLLSKQIKLNSYNYFSAYVISEKMLKISEFNRLIKPDKPIDHRYILDKISINFDIEKVSCEKDLSYKKKRFIMFFNNSSYFIKINKDKLPKHKSYKTEPEIINNLIIKDIFGIKDLSRDSRISFIKGNRDTKSILKIKTKAESDKNHIGFVLNPLSLDEIKELSISNIKLAPKSTYIQPKIPNGMLIYEME